MTRIVVCDDSRTYAAALKRFLERDPDLEVIGVYSTAEELMGHLPRDRPDLVTMDLELPGIDGVEATERIMRSARPLPVVVLSAHVSPGSVKAAAALAGGAVDAILKSDLRLTEADSEGAAAMRRRFARLARARPRRVVGDRAPTTADSRRPTPAARRRTADGAATRAVGIAASTGGPQALALVLAALPANFPIPLLIVQHIAPGFTRGLADWLRRLCALPVAVAPSGRPAGPGVWFAPDDAHLTVDRNLVIGHDTRTKAGRHRPAADVLFHSMARALGPGAAAVC